MKLRVFCGIVVRVPDYISRCPGLDTLQDFFLEVVGLQRGPLSLVFFIEILGNPELYYN
jgi:hypothetical protein